MIGRNLKRLGLLVAILSLVTLFGAVPAASGALVFGTTGTYTLTKTSDVNKIWRKIQANLQKGFNFMCEEWEALEDLQNFDVDWSTREIIVPLDITEGYGVATIPEAGYEARPSSPNAQELSLTWVMFNKRFTASKTARYIDERNKEAMVKRQLLFQGKKAIEDISRHYSDYFFGFSTAYLAQVNGDPGAGAGSHTVTIDKPYGSSLIATTTTAQKNFLCDKFRVNDYVALIRAGALVTNGIGKITAITKATPSLDITWNGSCDPADDDYIVKANSLENTTIDGTDYSLGLTGLLDGCTSASVHSLATSAEPNWAVATSDTTGGRLSGIRLHKAADEVANKGGGNIDTIWLAQGVKRDMIALERASLRFNDPYALEIDGDVKAKGRTFKSSRRVPPGMAFIGVKKSLYRMTLLKKPTEGVAWSDGKEMQDQSGFVFSMDFPCALVWTNRANWAYLSGLDEQ